MQTSSEDDLEMLYTLEILLSENKGYVVSDWLEIKVFIPFCKGLVLFQMLSLCSEYHLLLFALFFLYIAF